MVGQLTVSEQWNEMASISRLQQPSPPAAVNHVPVEAWSFTTDDDDDDVTIVTDSFDDEYTSASEGKSPSWVSDISPSYRHFPAPFQLLLESISETTHLGRRAVVILSMSQVLRLY